MENEKQSEIVNYEAEAEKLTEGGNPDYWSPAAGQYIVTALEEPKRYTATFKDEQKQRIKFRAEVVSAATQKMEQVTYTANVSGAKNSHYGQIIRLGKKWGVLQGKPFTLIVTGKDLQKKYTIVEAAGLP